MNTLQWIGIAGGLLVVAYLVIMALAVIIFYVMEHLIKFFDWLNDRSLQRYK